MLIRETHTTTYAPYPEGLPCLYREDGAVYFDIETTGLSSRTSHLVMIGAAKRNGDGFHCIQWMCRKPSDEPALLKAFAEYIRDCSILVHYNGSTFDIPYLTQKFASYSLGDPLADKESKDLYQILKPYKKHFCLCSFKLKDAEKCAGFHRLDMLSGKEIIDRYQKYLASGEEAYGEEIFLHNLEDLYGLLAIRSLLLIPLARKGQITPVLDLNADTMDLILNLPSLPFFAPAKGYLPDSGRVVLKAVDTIGYYFFKDYKNYYYFPEADEAFHKRVAIYSDPASRIKASSKNCYTKKRGLFYEAPSSVIEPVYYAAPDKKSCLFQATDLAKAEPEALAALYGQYMSCPS